MRKWSRIALAVVFVVILGLTVLAVLSRPAPEQAYQGKTLRQWLVLLDSNTAHKTDNDAAARAIENMGKEALPSLIRILEKRPSPALLVKMEEWAERFHLMPPPELQLEEWQYRAARACCILGGWHDVDITSAIAALAYHATNDVAWRLEPFMWGLVYSGPEGLSIVTNLLVKGTSAQLRDQAAHSLWITAKIRTPDIASVLLAATRDVDSTVRVTAILSLQSFSRQEGLDKIIVPGVSPCLQDTNAEVRRWTIELLGKYSSTPGVSAALSNLLSDPVLEVRNRAAEILARTRLEAGKQ